MDKQSIFAAFAARKPEIVEVPVPEIGQTWHVKEMNKEEDVHFVDRLEEFAKGKKGNAWLACCSVCDADGKRVFEDTDVDRLATLPDKVLRRVYRIAGELNGHLTEDLEEMRKNLRTPSGAS
jgi:hypothetical protein